MKNIKYSSASDSMWVRPPNPIEYLDHWKEYPIGVPFLWDQPIWVCKDRTEMWVYDQGWICTSYIFYTKDHERH